MIIEKSSSFGPRLIFTQLLASTALKQDEDKDEDEGIDMDEEKDKVKDEMRIRKRMRRRMKRTRTGLNNKGVFLLASSSD